MVSRARHSLLALGTVVVLAIAATFTGAPALADTAPPDAGTPATVAADALPTPQINGVVWAQLIVGDTVYVGGEFTRARPAGSAAGVNEVVRNNLLAYTLSTGVLTSFNPNVNGAVRALVAATDSSRVYAGGTFTSVGGVSRYRLAAFTASSGALVTSWAPQVNGRVSALGISNTAVYAGGAFTSAGGQARPYMASFATSNGAVQPWKGTPAGGGVNAITVSPDGTKVIVGGAFTSYNGGTNPGYGMVATNATTGAPSAWKVNSVVRNGGAKAAILSLTSTSAGVFGTGYDFGSTGNFEGTFRATWADGTITWLEDCHGDTYSAAPTNDVVYTTGHTHYCGNIGGFGETTPRSYHRTVSFSMNATGTVATNTVPGYSNFGGKPRPSLLTFYPDINTGTYTGQGQGPWTVTANSQYVLYGGEFTIVNNKKQQGLVRFAVSAIAPDKEGPRLAGADFVPTLTTPSSGSVTVAWTSNYDRDNELLTYAVQRGGVTVKTLTGRSMDWKRPALSWTETGLAGGTYSYRIKVTDPFGNTKTGNAASVTVANGAAAKRQAAPAPAFQATITGLDVAVDATSVTSASGAPIVSYAWDFGDTATAAGVTAGHRYAQAGSYPVTLTATDADGVKLSITQSVDVTAPPAENPAPKIDPAPEQAVPTVPSPQEPTGDTPATGTVPKPSTATPSPTPSLPAPVDPAEPPADSPAEPADPPAPDVVPLETTVELPAEDAVTPTATTAR
ncbi:PKD domain-containing protein [Cryobacterium arcticum]|uniref:PKD domain-containing protein n=1 Tax=Cryobacterium arcticum TaxID=670052 RepID=A0A317ZPS6_9MICO|nr:PKD domain-containing protein [Cryobacterium arcticum]PXA65697.1 PKD domain-containing protein [Cryobacterium arcticum]